MTIYILTCVMAVSTCHHLQCIISWNSIFFTLACSFFEWIKWAQAVNRTLSVWIFFWLLVFPEDYIVFLLVSGSDSDGARVCHANLAHRYCPCSCCVEQFVFSTFSSYRYYNIRR
jgi:hypothetical protein